jgi:hypothetical protein
VSRDVQSADQSGVAGTPTFFVNGMRHYGAYDEATLSEPVRQILRQGLRSGADGHLLEGACGTDAPQDLLLACSTATSSGHVHRPDVAYIWPRGNARALVSHLGSIDWVQ